MLFKPRRRKLHDSFKRPRLREKMARTRHNLQPACIIHARQRILIQLKDDIVNAANNK